MAGLCVSVAPSCGYPGESELALEEASPSFVEVDRQDLQAGLHLAAGAIVALPPRTGMGAISVTDLGPYVGPFGGHFGVPWGSFPVGILNPISVTKTTTRKLLFHNKSLQMPNSRRQNDDRKRGQNRDRKTDRWIPKSGSKRTRIPPPRKVKIWPRPNPPLRPKSWIQAWRKFPSPTNAEWVENARRHQFLHPSRLLPHSWRRHGPWNRHWRHG